MIYLNTDKNIFSIVNNKWEDGFMPKIKGNFRAMFHRFANGKAKTYCDGDWRVSVGGYDCWFEVYLRDE